MLVKPYVNFEIVGANLVIAASENARQEIREAQESGVNIGSDSFATDLIEHQLCNGWEIILPEECGALTNGLILTDDCSRDDMGNITSLGRVYWHERYQVESIGEMLMEAGRVTLIGAD